MNRNEKSPISIGGILKSFLTIVMLSFSTYLYAQVDFRMEQTGGPNPVTQVGDIIDFTITVDNAQLGAIPLSGVVVEFVDPNFVGTVLTLDSGDTDSNGVLDVGETWLYSSSYTIIQADIDNGSRLTNAVNLTTNELPTENIAAVTLISVINRISIEKTQTGGPTNITAANEVIEYTIVLTNEGQLSQTAISLSETFPGAGPNSLNGPTESGTVDNILSPGETFTYNATYTTTAADIVAGETLVNRVRVTTDQISDSQSSSASTPVNGSPIFTVTKNQVTGPNIVTTAGEQLEYDVVVTNLGSGNLTNVQIQEFFPGNGVSSQQAIPTESGTTDGILSPGETFTWRIRYQPDQDDIDTKINLINRVRATVDESSVILETQATTPIQPITSLTVTKNQTAGPTNVTAVGQLLTYEIAVRNTGTRTLTNLIFTDDFPGNGAMSINGPVESGTVDNEISPGESFVYTATYTVTQEDIDAAIPLVNRASAVTTEFPTTITDTAVTPVNGIPLFTVTKVQTAGPSSVSNPGEVITYEIEVANAGTVSLTNIVVDEIFPGSGANSLSTPIESFATGVAGTLEVGETFTYTATYTVLQEDIDTNSELINTANVTSQETGATIISDTAVTPVDAVLSLELVKQGTYVDANTNGITDVGDEISYTFVVTNTGNRTLNNITINDLNADVVVSGSPINLNAGETNNSNFTAQYSITQADIDAGFFENTAIASADEVDSPNAVSNVPLIQTFGITLEKNDTFDAGPDGIINPGDIITYNFTVRNTGNTTLQNIQVVDNVAGVVLSGGPLSQLDPGAVNTDTFTATYAITQTDIDNQQFSNQARVTALAPDNTTVVEDNASDDPDTADPDDPTITSAPNIAALQLFKSGIFNDENGDASAQAGETVSYTFSITNVGTATISNLTISDPLVTVDGGPLTSLAPGDTDNNTFTATYILTAADVANDFIFNQATVLGTDPDGGTVTDLSDDPNTEEVDDETATILERFPNISLSKVGVFNDENGDALPQIGETVSYTFSFRNTGNVPLTTITIDDPLVSVNGTFTGSLDPGEEDTTTFTATYSIVQADIDSRILSNQATVSAFFDNNGVQEEIQDLSDDPNNTADVDANGDGEPDDPTVLTYPADTDGDGIQDLTDLDDDNDGIPDAVELAGDASRDTDEDGIIDSLDQDSDGDGLFDWVEAGHFAESITADNRLEGPYSGDGISDQVQDDPDSGTVNYELADISDEDGIPNFQDSDDDNDSVLTIFEGANPDGDGNPLTGETLDTDNDEVPDFLDPDDDNDTRLTIDESPDPNGDGNPDDAIDTDEDGVPDYLDPSLDVEFTEFNAITPNGDSLNNQLEINGIELFPDNKMEIFNRWGAKVYETNGYGIGNNFFRGFANSGNESGKSLPSGTYFYVVNYSNGAEQVTKSGYLYIN
ncbi:gliding motility-associated C-terminal domain-containing protein [Spongiivirga sp. MCCC 1A20706]|uniref:DUF7507 domain-containing protein n=1 Tax=Spongiivirga sp. MCCC 1A20706 TaxID=3160963 RepID=UPI00397746F8